MGLFNGMFFGIFQMSQVIGNIIGAVVLAKKSSDDSTQFLFCIFLSVAGVGVLILALLRPENPQPRKNTKKEVESEPAQSSSLSQRILSVVMLLTDARMLLMIPPIFYSGLEMGFVSADFTKQCITDTIGASWIGYVMATFGAVDATSSIILGRVSDKFGKRIVVFIGALAQLSFIIAFMYMDRYQSLKELIPSRKWILFLGAGVYGIGDAVWNTFPSIMMSTFFTSRTEAAFSNLKLWQSLGFVCAFVWGPLLPFFDKLLVVLAVLIASVISIIVLDRFVAPINGVGRGKTSIQQE